MSQGSDHDDRHQPEPDRVRCPARTVPLGPTRASTRTTAPTNGRSTPGTTATAPCTRSASISTSCGGSCCRRGRSWPVARAASSARCAPTTVRRGRSPSATTAMRPTPLIDLPGQIGDFPFVLLARHRTRPTTPSSPATSSPGRLAVPAGIQGRRSSSSPRATTSSSYRCSTSSRRSSKRQAPRRQPAHRRGRQPTRHGRLRVAPLETRVPRRDPGGRRDDRCRTASERTHGR